MVNGNYTAQELNETIIPESVYGVLHGMGPDVFSWDVVSSDCFEKVAKSAQYWPNFDWDTRSTSLVSLDFVAR